MRLSDRIAGAGFAVLAAWIWVTAGTIRHGFGDPVGPTVFPRVVAAPMLLCALVMLFAPDPEPVWPRGATALRQAAAAATLFAYAGLLVPLGFPLATTAAVAALGRLFGASWGKGLAAGAAMGLGLWAVFDAGLGLPLPFAPRGF